MVSLKVSQGHLERTCTYRARRQNIAWHQSLAFRHSLDQIRNGEDQIISRSILTKFPIDPRLHTQNLVQILRRNRDWAHRTECIRRLPKIELFVISLSLPSSDIVDDRVTPHMLHSILLFYAPPWCSNDDTNLALIVHSLRELWVRINLVSIAYN